MEKLASKLLDQAKDFIEKNPKLVTGLAATGGAGALAGALMTGKGDPDESAGSRFMRRLKNALLTGGAAAGAAGLGVMGLDKLQNALPEGDKSPVDRAIHSGLVRALGAGLGGAAGAGAAAKQSRGALEEVFGKNTNMTKERLVSLLESVGKPGAASDPKSWEAIHKAFPKSTQKGEWLDRVGIDKTELKMPNLANPSAREALGLNELSKTTEAIKPFTDKIKLDTISRGHLSPEHIAKLLLKAKNNKYAIGGAAAGLLLPEALTTVGGVVGNTLSGGSFE